jgi:hypothetical protein
MTKLTGDAVAAHIANPPKPKNYAAALLSIEEVNASVAVSDAMTRKYGEADANFEGMTTAKSDALKRSLAELNMSDTTRAQHYEDGMRAWRKDAIKHFDSLALEHFRKANELLDAVRLSEEHNAAPINLAGRYGVVNAAPEVKEDWARVEGVQPAELRNIAVVALKTRSPSLCAAVCRRLAQLDKDGRKAVGISHQEVAEAGFGEQHAAIKRGLSIIKERAIVVRERYRSRMAGGSGQQASTSKISTGLAQMQRGPEPKSDEPPPRPKSITDQNREYFERNGLQWLPQYEGR